MPATKLLGFATGLVWHFDFNQQIPTPLSLSFLRGLRTSTRKLLGLVAGACVTIVQSPNAVIEPSSLPRHLGGCEHDRAVFIQPSTAQHSVSLAIPPIPGMITNGYRRGEDIPAAGTHVDIGSQRGDDSR
jgi:hypothetical protein